MLNSAKKIYLIHGWGADAAIMQTLAQPLEKYYSVTLINLPGYGHNKCFQVAESLTALARAIEAIIVGRAILIGWSLGGLVALKFTQLYPKKIIKVIALACTPYFIAAPAWPGIPANLFLKFEALLEKDITLALRRFALLQVQKLPRTHFAYSIIMRNYLGSSCSPLVLANGLHLLRTTDLRILLVNLAVPIQFILGEQDPLIPTALCASLRALSTQIEICTIAQAGHISFLTHTAAVLKNIKAFIEH